MDLKPHEIALLIVGIAAPVIFLVMGLIPGGLNWVWYLVADPVLRPFVFFGGAIVLFAVFAWRIYRRIRPAPRRPRDKPPAHVSPTRMPRVEGTQALERLRNPKPGDR